MSLRIIRERLQRFRKLDRREQGAFLRAAALLAALQISLYFVGFRRTYQTLQKVPRSHAMASPQTEDISPLVNTTVRMVRAAARYGIGRPTCLEESLILWFLLQRQGIPAQLRIGARKLDKEFEAHAWVECGGAAINDPEELHRHYAAFDGTLPVGLTETQ